jgi:hypothetical protein
MRWSLTYTFAYVTKTGANGGYAQQSVVSQFVTVDEAGLVIFWVTSEKGLGFLDTTGEWDTGSVRYLVVF